MSFCHNAVRWTYHRQLSNLVPGFKRQTANVLTKYLPPARAKPVACAALVAAERAKQRAQHVEVLLDRVQEHRPAFAVHRVAAAARPDPPGQPPCFTARTRLCQRRKRLAAECPGRQGLHSAKIPSAPTPPVASSSLSNPPEESVSLPPTSPPEDKCLAAKPARRQTLAAERHPTTSASCRSRNTCAPPPGSPPAGLLVSDAISNRCPSNISSVWRCSPVRWFSVPSKGEMSGSPPCWRRESASVSFSLCPIAWSINSINRWKLRWKGSVANLGSMSSDKPGRRQRCPARNRHGLPAAVAAMGAQFDEIRPARLRRSST